MHELSDLCGEQHQLKMCEIYLNDVKFIWVLTQILAINFYMFGWMTSPQGRTCGSLSNVKNQFQGIARNETKFYEKFTEDDT